MLQTFVEILILLVIAIPAVTIGFLLGAEPDADCEEDPKRRTHGGDQDVPSYQRWWCAWKQAKLPLSLPTILTALIFLAGLMPSAFGAAGVAQIDQSLGQNLLMAKALPIATEVAATQTGTPIPEPTVGYPPVVDTPQPDVQQPSVAETPQQVSVSPTPSEELIKEDPAPAQITPEVDAGQVALTVTVDLTRTLKPIVPPNDLVDIPVITPTNIIASKTPAPRVESSLPLTDHECDQSTPGVLALLSPVRDQELTCSELANGGYAIRGRVPSKYIWYEVQYALTNQNNPNINEGRSIYPGKPQLRLPDGRDFDCRPPDVTAASPNESLYRPPNRFCTGGSELAGQLYNWSPSPCSLPSGSTISNRTAVTIWLKATYLDPISVTTQTDHCFVRFWIVP